MPMEGGFDAQTVTPRQVGTAHPPGKYPAQITNTEITSTKDGTGGMFVVTFNTPAGDALFRYNIWNQSPKAVEIAQGQLSALCHAVGIFKVAWQNDGAALRGARCQIEVADQLTDGKPNGYTQITKIYDANGNEPGKAPAAAPQPAAQQGGGWGAQGMGTVPAATTASPNSWQQNQPQATNAPAKPPWAS